MRFRWLSYFLLFISFLVLLACEDCGPTDEPILTLAIQSQMPIQIDTQYGVGAVGRLLQKVNLQSNSFQLPLDLNADSTRYILLMDGHSEAITVFYKRDFHYRSNMCGYVFDLEKPDAPFTQQAKTTRGKVVSIGYTQNSFNAGFLRQATSTTGIQLVINL